MTTVADAELQVRLRRAAFNRALAEADLPVIGQILSPDAVLVTGTDSAVIAGRKAQLQAWKREFSARPRTIYTRSTERSLPLRSSRLPWSMGAGVALSLKRKPNLRPGHLRPNGGGRVACGCWWPRFSLRWPDLGPRSFA